MTRQTNFEAIGAPWWIEVRDELSEEQWDDLLERVRATIEEFDLVFSRFRPDSVVSQMSHKPGTYELPDGAYELVAFYERLYRFTDGKVTPLIGNVLEDLGYDADYRLEPGKPTSPPDWSEMIEYTPTSLTLKNVAMLDFGAAGKGRLVDLIARVVEDAGARDYTIDASGDMIHLGQEPLAVGMEDPLDPNRAIGIVRLSNQSLCASSGAKRTWSGYTHIIDPDELKSPDDVIATWVIANDTMTADGLATALFFVKPESLVATFPYSYAVLRHDMQLEYSPDFPAELFKDTTK